MRVMKKNGDVMGEVERFKYLGSVLQENGRFEKDMNYTIKVWTDE